MARVTGKRGGGRHEPLKRSYSERKSNAAAFRNRRFRSDNKRKTGEESDVYDYQPTKNRRRNVTLALDEDESRGAAYDDKDGEDLDGEMDSRWQRRPRLVGEDAEDERLGSDEDEEIDSDAAFDDSDEEKFAGSGFMKKERSLLGANKFKRVVPKKAERNVRFLEVNLDEEDGPEEGESDSEVASGASEDEEEEEGEDGEFVDVLDILDGRAEPYNEDEDGNTKAQEDRQGKMTRNDFKMVEKRQQEERGSEEDEEDKDDEEEDEDEGDSGVDEDVHISGSEDEEDASAIEALGSFVSGLESSAKRKASDEKQDTMGDGLSGQEKKKRRLLKDRTESAMEGEFSANATGSSKLSLDDLLTSLAPKQSALAALKKSIKPLASSSNPKNQPLAAPLPTRIQEKLEREAAYEQTKQEVDKWTDTMKRIREAEHLSFPLQAPRSVKVSNLELTAKFKPTTELESSIDRLLKSAKLREEDINKTEDLMMKDLTVEEVAERRVELRKMRELAFRADAKAKRVAKIKSKTFRRLRKKELAKLRSKLDVSGELDEAGMEDERLRAETERARERATLKHKNTGKWAKAMKARGELDVDQRREINDMLERGERLRRRIQGARSGDESGSESSDEDAEDGDDGALRIKGSAFEELEALQGLEEGESSESAQKPKSVFQMKFMKDAASRKNQAIEQDIDDFRREVGDLPAGSDEEAEDEADLGVAPPVERVNGRMVFRPGLQSSAMLPPPPLSAISETSTLRSHDSIAHSPVLTLRDEPNSTPPPPSSSSVPVSVTELSNPWLVDSSSSTKITKRKNELVVGKDVTRAQKSEQAMQKQLKKGSEERQLGQNDAVIEIAVNDVLLPKSSEKPVDSAVAPTVNGTSKKRKDKKKENKVKDKERSAQPEGEDSDANSENEEQEAALRKGSKAVALEQRELVARAFAGDNVVREFAKEKRKEIEADAPREVDTTLAGWGSWGGAGLKKALPKPHLIKKVAGIDPKSRADYGKSHVIISERRDKKALKFAVKDLPYPYTSKAQFEARMSTPLGVEWNTRLGFQRATLPRVVKKMGTIIDPLEKL